MFSDSKSVLEALQNESLQNSSLKSLFLTTDSFLKIYDVDLTLQWIPGHCNITGNEIADTLTKKGSTAQQQNTTTSFRTAQQIIRNNSTEEWLNGWATGKTGRSLFTYMATPNPKDSINSLERRDQVIIFRLRTHHAPDNAHLNRIQPMTPPVCHFCDAPYETTTHLLFQCTSLQDLREEYLPPRSDAWNTLYSNSQQLKKTSTFYSQKSSRRAKAQTTAGSDKNVYIASGETIMAVGAFSDFVGILSSVTLRYEKYGGTGFGAFVFGAGKNSLSIDSVRIVAGDSGHRYDACNGQYVLNHKEEVLVSQAQPASC
ncbi:RNA-directed DNA polymerase from [Elysia marginata]|uniref:RNA-directed DNA polymerase from n=1 Tax=Elysia marginata TaxID=1093978 RepID=A0AAV4F570_9GAST|nr:RNA-directed DNA polymerase from [Elysia marginata]